MLKVIFIGNVGGEAEERYTAAGKRIVQFSVAVNERRPVKDSDEWADHANWFRVRVMGRQCDYAQNLQKGNRVQVIGNLSIDAYVSQKDNAPRASLDVFADEITNLTPRDQTDARDVAMAAGVRAARSSGETEEATSLEDLPF